MLNSHRGRQIFIFKGKYLISWIQETVLPDKVPLALGIKIAPYHHILFIIPRDWHGFISVSLIAGLICNER